LLARRTERLSSGSLGPRTSATAFPQSGPVMKQVISEFGLWGDIEEEEEAVHGRIRVSRKGDPDSDSSEYNEESEESDGDERYEDEEEEDEEEEDNSATQSL